MLEIADPKNEEKEYRESHKENIPEERLIEYRQCKHNLMKTQAKY